MLPRFALILCLGLALVFALSARAQESGKGDGLSHAARQARIAGEITAISPGGMTINSFGQEITVDAAALSREGEAGGGLDDYFAEGMHVEVEGVLSDRDKIDAARITRISRSGAADTRPPAVPYIADDPGIISADELQSLAPSSR